MATVQRISLTSGFSVTGSFTSAAPLFWSRLRKATSAAKLIASANRVEPASGTANGINILRKAQAARENI
ncbi:MAG: hypothetical protein JWL59_386 [Chthoniobacteraceae bacterium]|nr:hypothetical protein [Chthoniobacteraceae bacterium]